MGIAMRKMFEAIEETPDKVTNLTIDEIEKALITNYKERTRITAKYEADQISDNYYDAVSDVLFEDEQRLYEAYKKYSPYAFNEGTLMDESIYTELNIAFERGEYISPDDILNATKIDDTDAIYLCKIRTFYKGKFVNNYVKIYMDNDYTNREDIFKEDYNNTCSAIAYAMHHKFVAVLDIRKI